MKTAPWYGSLETVAKAPLLIEEPETEIKYSLRPA
jgi:hypothetical protein